MRDHTILPDPETLHLNYVCLRFSFRENIACQNGSSIEGRYDLTVVLELPHDNSNCLCRSI